MRIIFFGNTDFSAAMLRALISAGHEIALAVTSSDRPKKRGHRPQPTAIRILAKHKGIPCAAVSDLKDPSFIADLAAIGADLGVVVAFKILPPAVFNAPRMGTINVHPSLLPDLRGPAPVRWAIIGGYERTGVTTFLLDENVDTGDLLLSESLDIGPNETFGELSPRVSETSERLLLRTIDDLAAGTIEPFPQTGAATRAPKITPELCRIDWNEPATRIHNLVRALSPTPGAWTELDSRRIKVLRTLISERTGPPGTVIGAKEGLTVACGAKAVEIIRIQVQGKRATDVEGYLHGNPIEKGARLI